MPQGLQVWNAAGTLIVDTNTRVFQQTGYVDTGTNNGSVNVGNSGYGAVAYFVGQTYTSGGIDIPPGITVSGSTISWSWVSNATTLGNKVGVRIYYGYY